MPRYDADSNALKGLDSALVTFAGQQFDAFTAIESEIAATLQSLDMAEQRWRSEVERRSDELQNCSATQPVTFMDCSAESAALCEAEDKLMEIIQWQSRVQEAMTGYRAASERFSSVLENDLPRARAFLQGRMMAVEAYESATILSNATGSPGANMPAIKSGVVSAARHSAGELQRMLGDVGEQITAQILSERFGLKEISLDKSMQNIGRSFTAPGMPLVVIESRTNLAREQIADVVNVLSAQAKPVMAIIINPAKQSADVYARSSLGEWQLCKVDQKGQRDE